MKPLLRMRKGTWKRLAGLRSLKVMFTGICKAVRIRKRSEIYSSISCSNQPSNKLPIHINSLKGIQADTTVIKPQQDLVVWLCNGRVWCPRAKPVETTVEGTNVRE
jgi:hypothetical protein